MKKIISLGVIFVFLLLCFQATASEKITLGDVAKYNDDYINFYSIKKSDFTYESNGGQVSDELGLDKAFDGNYSTYWQSDIINSTEHINNVTITFNKTVTIKTILYQAEQWDDGRGYPITLSIYTDSGNIGSGETAFYGSISSKTSRNLVAFELAEALDCKKLVFEYTDINKKHKLCATAKEFVFLSPKIDAVEKVRNLFKDYSHYELIDGMNRNGLTSLRNEVSNLPIYETNLKAILDRAELISVGVIQKDERREFSTDPQANNVIARNGDVRGYAGNTLKTSSFGTNRQTTGLYALANQQITVYVTGKSNDPLPSIVFTQPYGHWKSWQATVNLSLGTNVITVPSFIKEDLYTVATNDASVIHFVNPYEESQQSTDVKMYIEGGNFYPLFRKGSDEDTFRLFLADYAAKAKAYPEIYPDVLEVEGKHTLITVRAINVFENNVYTDKSPEVCINNWDNTVRSLVEFVGIPFDKQDSHYNPKNEFLRINIRMVQPWAGAAAFAAGDHIGVISWESGCYDGVNIGWGFAHEIGHALDIGERVAGECSNNMVSQFNMVVLDNNNTRSSDGYAKAATELGVDGSKSIGNYWNQNRQNWLIFWLIESRFPGFWGRQDNIYRYQNTATGLTKTEKQVYYASLATGIDLSYYFEKWGYDIDKNVEESVPFSLENASLAFKNYMAEAKANHLISSDEYKLWYLDNENYTYLVNKGQGCYEIDDVLTDIKLNKLAKGYSITMPKSTDPAHLGYEIIVKVGDDYKVIGFTKNNSFTDTNTYNTDVTYYVKAYDRLLNSTQMTEAVLVKYEKAVCKVGETTYDYLADALNAVEDGGTIVLLKDIYEASIKITKNVTIINGSGKTLTIFKNGDGSLFTVDAAVTLTLGDTQNRIVLDGCGINGSIITVNGTVVANNVDFINGLADQGGAVYIKGVFQANNSTFKDNTAKNGGAIYCDATGSTVRINLDTCTLEGNQATIGGAVAMKCVANIANCHFIANSAVDGGAIANTSGGVLTVRNSDFAGNIANKGGTFYIDGKTTLIEVNSSDSVAKEGSLIYFNAGNTSRALIIEGLNSDEADIYLVKGIVNLSKLAIEGNITQENGEVNFKGSEISFNKFYKLAGTINISAIPKENLEFVLQDNEQSLLKFTGVNAEELLNKLTVADSSLDSAGSEIVATKLTYSITYNVAGEEQTYEYKKDSEVVLTDLELPKHYVTHYLNGSEVIDVNSSIFLNSNLYLTAVLAEKIVVTLNYSENEVETFIKPNTYFYLPKYNLDDREIVYWELENEIYRPFDAVYVTKAITISAAYSALVVTFVDEKNGESKDIVDYQQVITLPQNDNPDFIGWQSGEKIYKAGEIVQISEIMIFTAVYQTESDKPTGDTTPESDKPTGDTTPESNKPTGDSDAESGKGVNAITKANLTPVIAGVSIFAVAAIVVLILIFLKKKSKKS